ncbi:hypothetical protein BQ8482_360124 [Mesorhizobium delmotii]|uniref:Uncharacterized protein n=1 Tax=Mesorhizobium delmotii TaxID=1631247 RepID=A0A2P9ARH6_9HYPH|nr:hypothetical protein BQ8482_360124 [Mesorhizobium delmotii]
MPSGRNDDGDEAFDTTFEGENEFYASNTIAHCYAKKPIKVIRNRHILPNRWGICRVLLYPLQEDRIIG